MSIKYSHFHLDIMIFERLLKALFYANFKLAFAHELANLPCSLTRN